MPMLPATFSLVEVSAELAGDMDHIHSTTLILALGRNRTSQ